MGAAVNGMAAHGGIIPFGSTFLIFSDYLRPSMRLAALMELGVIYVFTHDSIGVGEDGPTHQPIEQLAALRAIPRLMLIRPGDANETAVAWQRRYRDPRPAGRVGAVAAERADPRSNQVYCGSRRSPGRLRLGRSARGQTGHGIDRYWIGTVAGGSRSGKTAGTEKSLPALFRCPAGRSLMTSHRTIVSSSCRPIVRARLAVEAASAVRLASLRRRRRRRTRYRALWRVGSGQHRHGEIRFHCRSCRRARPRTDREITCAWSSAPIMPAFN